jgi:hypothetical protein
MELCFFYYVRILQSFRPSGTELAEFVTEYSLMNLNFC